MKKEERVKSNIVFNNIIKKGKKISNSYYTLFYIYSENEKPLYGISAPVKCGNAVVRNKLKRQTREIVDNLKKMFPKNKNYIIIIKDRCKRAAYDEKINALSTLIGEIK